MSNSATTNFKLQVAPGVVKCFSLESIDLLEKNLNEFGLSLDNVYMKNPKGSLVPLRRRLERIRGEDQIKMFAIISDSDDDDSEDDDEEKEIPILENLPGRKHDQFCGRAGTPVGFGRRGEPCGFCRRGRFEEPQKFGKQRSFRKPEENSEPGFKGRIGCHAFGNPGFSERGGFSGSHGFGGQDFGIRDEFGRPCGFKKI